MKVAIYTRQSLDKSGDELGIERQLSECQRLVEQRGYTIVTTIQDNNRSATTGARPGYEQVVDLIERKAVDAIVAYRLDRLLRRLVDLEQLIELSERTGVQVITVQGDVDLTNSQGRLIGRILASVARSEMETKSERHRLANAQKAAAGKPHGSRRPYGYESDLMTIRESEAAVLREMGRRVISGHSYKEVAWWANEQGHTTTTGRPWLPLTIRNMLRKPRYGGIREHNGAHYPAAWPAVFDERTWERLQLTMRLRSSNKGVKPRKYMLTGLVYCGICGLPLNGSTKQDRPGAPKRRVYYCRPTGDTSRERGCGRLRRNADALEDFVARSVLYRLDTPYLAQLLEQESDDSEVAYLLEDRKAQSDRLAVLVDDYATGLLTREQFARAKNAAESELQRLDGEIERLNRERNSSGLLPVGERLEDAWDSSESDAWKRSVIELLVKRIDVLPGNTKPFYVTRDGRRMRFDENLVDIKWIA